MEHKTTQAAVKSIEDRTVIGIAAVHGIVDGGNDRSHPGSFADTKINGRDRIRFLWQHDSTSPPIATINYVREVSAGELPQKVLGFAPEATGGVEVSRTYLTSQRANEVLEGIKAGAIEEMSYAYDVTSYTMTEEKGQPPIRELLGLKIFDLSDVSWGMNPATVGSKSWSGAALTFVEHSEMVGTIVEEYSKRAKDRSDFRQSEGRPMSDAMRDRIEQMMLALRDTAKEIEKILADTSPKTATDQATVLALFIEYQQTIARLNGVNYAN